MFTHFHFSVQSALFRQVTDIVHIFSPGRTTVDKHLSAIWSRDAGDDPDKGSLPCSVWAKQTENCTSRDINAYPIQCQVVGILLYDVDGFYVHLFFLNLLYFFPTENPPSLLPPICRLLKGK